MDPLKLAVERIVRPIRVEESLKDTFREELWGHLTDLFRQECERYEGEDDALAAAVERLGNPKALRRNYIQSLPWIDRTVGYFEQFFGPKQDRPPLGQALDIGAKLFTGTVLTILIVTLPFYVSVSGLVNRELWYLSALGLLVSAVVSVFVSAFVFTTWHCEHTVLTRATLTAADGLRLAGISMTSHFIVLTCAITLYTTLRLILSATLGPDHAQTISFVHVGTALWPIQFTLLLAASALIPVLTTRDIVRRKKRLPDWPYIEPV
jgi:hypothetical protein